MSTRVKTQNGAPRSFSSCTRESRRRWRRCVVHSTVGPQRYVEQAVSSRLHNLPLRLPYRRLEAMLTLALVSALPGCGGGIALRDRSALRRPATAEERSGGCGTLAAECAATPDVAGVAG